MRRETKAALVEMAGAATRAAGGRSAKVTVCEPSPADRRGYYYPNEMPVAVIEFDYLPSINDALFAFNAHRRVGSKFVEEWQTVGREAVCSYAKANGIAVEPFVIVKRDNKGNEKKRIDAERLKRLFTVEPVEVVVRIWRPDAANYDVHNPFVKPVLDGFTSARLWIDDGCKRVPRVVLNYEGIDRSLALTDDEKDERARKQAEHATRQRRRGKKETPMRMPKRALYRFEFYQRTGSQVPLFART